jgi:hypothetical protein
VRHDGEWIAGVLLRDHDAGVDRRQREIVRESLGKGDAT